MASQLSQPNVSVDAIVMNDTNYSYNCWYCIMHVYKLTVQATQTIAQRGLAICLMRAPKQFTLWSQCQALTYNSNRRLASYSGIIIILLLLLSQMTKLFSSISLPCSHTHLSDWTKTTQRKLLQTLDFSILTYNYLIYPFINLSSSSLFYYTVISNNNNYYYS